MDAVLNGKKIFITGGTGFLGSLVLKFLRTHALETNSDISVTVLSRNPESFYEAHPELLWSGLTFLKGDVESFHFTPGSEFDYILHGGNPSEVPTDEAAGREFKKTVVDGTNHLLAEISGLGKTPNRILLLSSGAVYGPQPSEVSAFTEDFATKAGNLYADAKLAAEEAMINYANEGKIRLTIGRIFACAGAYVPLDGRFALGNFIRSARDTGEIRIQSDGKQKRSYLAGDELAEWLITLLVSKSLNTEVFNIGSGDAVTIQDIAETIRECFLARGKTVSLVFGTALAPSYIPDVGRIEKMYGLKPRKSSLQAVQETATWFLDKP